MLSKRLTEPYRFQGRIGRRRFWVMSVVADILTGSGVYYFFMVFPTNTSVEGGCLIAFISGIVIWAATCVKRLHDRDKSGKWIFVALIPVVGLLVGTLFSLIELGLLAGSSTANNYGPPPGTLSSTINDSDSAQVEPSV